MKILCKWFGHAIHPVDLLVAEIKANEFNRGRCSNILTCKRCGFTIDLNDDDAIDTYLQQRKHETR